MRLKGWFTHKWRFCHDLLILFPSLKDFDDQRVLATIDFHYLDKNTGIFVKKPYFMFKNWKYSILLKSFINPHVIPNLYGFIYSVLLLFLNLFIFCPHNGSNKNS